MKLATTTADFGRYTIDHLQRVKYVEEAGFKYIDLSMYTPRENDGLFFTDDWKKTAEALKSYAEEKGLHYVQAHGPNSNPLKSQEDFDYAVEITTRAIEICSYLGIPNMVIHPGWDKDATKEEWFVKNKHFFEKLFPVMEKCNVNVLHENTTNANMPWYFSKTGKEMREFSDFVNHPMVHSCWDTGHANIEGQQYDEILAIGDDLYAIHFNDNRGKQDEHIIPYLGTMNCDEIINALLDIGFKGPLTFEAESPLRPSKYWLGKRKIFEKDVRLAEPPLCLQQEIERFMYSVGKYILSAYDLFEE